MDGGDSNSGGLKIHHDNSQPTSTSPAGSGFESLETNTSTTSSGSPVAPVSSPTPTPAPTPAEATSPDATETTTEAPIATPAATPVSTPPDVTAGPAPGIPLDTPISSSVAPSAPAPSTTTPGAGFTTPGSFATPSRFPTPQNRVVPPQQPAFPPAVSPAMGAGIMSSRFDTGESYASEPKSTGRGKKLAIVLVLLLLIVAIGVGIWWVLSKNNNSSQSEITASSFDAYKRYANFLLYGEDKTDDIGGDVFWNDTQIMENLPPGSTNGTDYFNKLSSLYSTFLDKFNKSNTDNKPNAEDGSQEIPQLQADVENAEFSLNTLVVYSSKAPIPDSEIIGRYLANGKDETLVYVGDYYSDFINSSNTLLNEYAETETLYVDSLTALIDDYGKNGCISDNTISESCISSINLPEEKKTIEAANQSYKSSLGIIEYNIVNNVVDASRKIYLEYEEDNIK